MGLARALVVVLVLASGCSDDGLPDEDEGALVGGDDLSLSCQGRGPAPVVLTTQDGLRLEADFHPSGEVGGPGVVLLHMVPPQNDKSNYPPEFIDALQTAGYTVINVNRRGAGRSEGDPEDAYRGDTGRFDVAAAHAFASASQCMVPPEGIVVVGASNGTTSALDFAVTTEGPKPRALVFLSPGQYTEAQYTIADQRAALEPIPILFAYPGAEAAYSNAIAAAAPATWQFIEYAEGSHGTGLLQTPRVVEDIVGFLAQ